MNSTLKTGLNATNPHYSESQKLQNTKPTSSTPYLGQGFSGEFSEEDQSDDESATDPYDDSSNGSSDWSDE